MPINEMAFGVPPKSATDPLGYGAPVGGMLLDNFPNAAAAYSLRRLSSSYNGACIRVRRSTDNAELNIGFLNDGSLDQATLLNFVGRVDGFVTTWYDQSGNGRNATKTTTTQQPRIVNAGEVDKLGINIIIRFDGTDDFLNTGSVNVFRSKANGSFYSVAQYRTSPTSGNSIVYVSQGGSVGSRASFGGGSSANKYEIAARRSDGATTATLSSVSNVNTSSTALVTSVFDYANTSGFIYINGILNASNLTYTTGGSTTSNTDSVGIGLGARQNGLGPSPVNIQEVIIYENISNRPFIESSINQYYSIY